MQQDISQIPVVYQETSTVLFSNMRLPTEEEFLFLRDKYGNDMFKSALCTIEGRVDIRSKWDVLYNAVLKQFEFMKDEK